MGKINTSFALISALIGGLAIAVFTSVPILNLINLACCLGMMIGGFLGVLFYKSKYPVSLKAGALVGFLSGVVGGIISAIVEIVLFFARGGTTYAKIMSQLGLGWSVTLWVIITVFTNLMLCIGFGTLGGLFGGMVFKKKGESKEK